uniref:Uncharacterized protein n=1 Tax=Oryza punctata TaxID=4537 RepID=A0A0E0LRS6_ORYPU
MATVLARLAGKQQLLLLQYALRRSPARRLAGVVPLPLLCSAPFLGSRRLKYYNAAAGVAVGCNKPAADDHHRHAVGADLDDELASEEHYSAAGTSSSSREYHSVVETVAAADGDLDGGEKKVTRPARGGGKAGVLLAWGEPEPGGGPHYH